MKPDEYSVEFDTFLTCPRCNMDCHEDDFIEDICIFCVLDESTDIINGVKFGGDLSE